MDQGPPESKRPRLFGSHAGVQLLHPTPSPTHSASQLPHQPPPGQYHHPPPHPYPRAPELHPPPHSHPQHHPPTPHLIIPPPPPPPPPPSHPQAPNQIDDRRHHEPDRYPPMQEHRQPPPSPAHPQYPYAMVKPDPGEVDTLPHLRRPHSTGNAPEALPGTPHSSHPPHPPPSQAPPADDRRHMSYDAGPPAPLYRQPSYPAPPQTPIPHSTPYEYGASYGAAHHDMAQYAIPLAASGKRKAQRASQACDSCRQLKAKCDETKPCKSCKEKKLECKYRDPAPKAQDKVSADILDAIMDFRGFVDQRMSFNDRRVSLIQRVLADKFNLPMEALFEDDGSHRPLSGPADAALSYSPALATNSPEMEVEGQQQSSLEVKTEADAHIAASQARDTLRELAKNEEMDDEPPGPPVAPGQPAIPLNHTTLASMLLKWKPIKQLVQHHLAREGIKYVDEFPIQQEERRGLLRLFGRGEGQGTAFTDRESSVDQGSWEGYDDQSDTGAPSPADCWGTIGSLSPPVISDSKGAANIPTLDFTESTVWAYVRSYEANIQNMHPLIIPKELHAIVRLFLENVNRTTAKRSIKHAGFTDARDQSLPQYPDIGMKRKRSPGVDASDTPPGVSPVSSKPAKPVFERSIQNALVLLVLALGKICLCRDKIPEVMPVSDPTQGSPVIRNGHPLSPIQGSPPSYASVPMSTALPSPKDLAGSRRGSFQGATNALPRAVPFGRRNLDVIPGLDYFATATDILGGQLAGATLRHVYANILAGLYHGQLGRVLESYAYIRQAGYALQTKMRPSLDRLSKLNKQSQTSSAREGVIHSLKDNQLVYAFWSCLQLESDIIAELPLPQSGILAFEENIPYPNQYLASQYGFDPRVLASFSAQLYLRKNLNQVHQVLYDPNKSQQSPLPLVPGLDAEFNIFKYIEEALDMRFVPPEFKFGLNDPPATDLLSARLRAKYWGARVITFRPFIRQILHFNENRTAVNSPAPISGDFRSEITVPVIAPEATTENDIDPKVIENAQKGVDALIQSTKAFHGLGPQRFIITNVFGTAHAQWGNLLVLSAVYKDPILSRFISERTLRDLLSKTISFFKLVAHSTSALSVDMRILQGLERELFYPRADVPGPNSSFSSTNTSDTLTLAPMVTGSAPGFMQAPGTPMDGILPPPPPVSYPS